MKKLYLIILLLGFTAFTFAQTINFGVKAGYNLSTFYFDYGYSAGYAQYLPGFNVGGIANIDFPKFSVQPGLFYSAKGEKVLVIVPTGNPPVGTPLRGSNQLNYIELPVNFLYKVAMIPGGNVHVGGGPYLGYGVSENGSVNGRSVSGPFAEFARNPDFGLNLVAGVQLKNKFLLDLSYGIGLRNLAGGGSTTQNRVMNFSVGYLFN